MTYLYTSTPAYFSDICEAVRLFIDTRKIEPMAEDACPADGVSVRHTLCRRGDIIVSAAAVFSGGVCVSENTYECDVGGGVLAQKRSEKRAAKISVYRALLMYFRTPMPWGSLTGIRPTKLLRDSETRLGEDAARALFLEDFDVSPGKYTLAKSIVDAQKELLPQSDRDIDVYIGIPFCVTRCAYCSFASSMPDVFKDAEALYMNALMAELDAAEELLAGRRVRAMYIGGGTPTALCVQNLERIVMRAAEIGGADTEFTVEAGRPDTISREKLNIIKAAGAGRISVNAQTLRDDTLMRIGRRHSAAQFFDAFALARQVGFDSINVDIIAGLPQETADDVRQTLEAIIGLAPENVTVHTLAIKRASQFAKDNMVAFPTSDETGVMVDAARDMLGDAGYHPYYLYRQKYMKGSQENTGYALRGHDCLYNIDNMEEACDVMAFGAGAISKRLFGGGARIERAANVKDLRTYITRHTEMIGRKRVLFGQLGSDKTDA